MEEKTFKGSSIERSKEKTIKILFAVAFVWALHVSHTHALAGFAEQVYRYEYSPGLRLNIGAPSDMCPGEFGNQRCMWVEQINAPGAPTEPYFRSPVFLSISDLDLAKGYIAGQDYNNKQWILFNIRSNEIEYSAQTETELRSKLTELGVASTLYDLQHAKDHFKKVKEPFDLIIFLIDALLLIIIISIPAGILFGIYKIIRKVFYPVQNNPIAPVDVTVNTSVPTSVPTETISEAVILPTATKPIPPTFTNNADVFKRLGAIVFILLAFLYVGSTFMYSSGDFSFASMFPKDKPLGGKVLYKMIANQEVIKEKKSLTLLHEKEGLLKDNLAVYRCTFTFNTYQNCLVQEAVKNPESFVRITNVYGQDSTTVYIVDGDTNRYKVFTKPEYKTFRSYFEPNDSHHGLYSWDDYQIFKGEKVIRGSSSSTLGTTTPALKPNYNVFRSTFFKQYYKDDIATSRNPYQGITQIDGNIQFASDGEYIYHGDGRSSATSDSIYVFKVNEADLATFQPYSQKMVGTSYLKYATDKSNIFCDNVRIDEEGYPVSDGLIIIKDPNPKSLKVIYPTGAITEKNAGLQVAKTDTQVFVNCTPQPQVDAATLTFTGATGFFQDKNDKYDFPKRTGTSSEDYLVPFKKNYDDTTYDTTKFCNFSNKSTSTPKGWNGVWYTKDSNYFSQSSLRICTNPDGSLYFLIDAGNSMSEATLGGFAKVLNTEVANGVGLDSESPKDRQRQLDCDVSLIKSTSTITTKITGKECNLYSGANASISNEVYRNNVVLKNK